MALSANLKRLALAVLAWPAGIIAAIAILVIRGLMSDCPSGQPCELQQTSWINIGLWLAIAFGPGVVATQHWWKNRRSAT